MSFGRNSTGGVVSVTRTSKRPVAVPYESVAVQVTRVVPRANCEPDAGVHVTGTSEPSYAVAETSNVTNAPSVLSASATTDSGVEICGGPGSFPLMPTLTVPGPMRRTVASRSVAITSNVWGPAVNATPGGTETIT